jgi:hypothetical protein
MATLCAEDAVWTLSGRCLDAVWMVAGLSPLAGTFTDKTDVFGNSS